MGEIQVTLPILLPENFGESFTFDGQIDNGTVAGGAPPGIGLGEPAPGTLVIRQKESLAPVRGR